MKVFQYRKRYGLHAINMYRHLTNESSRFNTASGMDCMQFLIRKELVAVMNVSIPQAVWIACNIMMIKLIGSVRLSFNTASGMDCMQ